MTPILKRPILSASKHGVDTLYNLASLIIGAISGLAINLLLLIFGGAEKLGVFNQLYAIFVVAGQLFVWAHHDTAQRFISINKLHAAKSYVLQSSCINILIISVLGSGFLYLMASTAGAWFDSQNVGQGIRHIAPALVLFPLNKVLLGGWQGERRMIEFALAQALRALVLMAVIAQMAWSSTSSQYYGLAFVAAELAVLLFVSWRGTVALKLLATRPLRVYMLRNFIFSTKGSAHAFLSELFIRIDIVMLGLLMSDYWVGVYGLIAFIVEGALQIPVVLRTVSNPLIARMLRAFNASEFRSFVRRTGLLSLAITTVVVAPTALIFPWLESIIDPQVIRNGYYSLLIMLVGVLLYSPFVPFDYLFLQAGRPLLQSLFALSNTLMNIVLNYVLISHFGIVGAALATAAAFFCAALTLLALSRLCIRKTRYCYF